ncbi:MAG: DEAD/DEAH box helicase family protein [Caenibius sp.]
MRPALPPPRPDFAEPTLNPGQQAAAARFVAAVRAAEFAPFLLDGVTGSGKTEVYFEAVAQALRMGRALVLVPEIALTEAFLRWSSKPPCAPPVLWHSPLKSTERRRAWRAIASGTAHVVVGARPRLTYRAGI